MLSAWAWGMGYGHAWFFCFLCFLWELFGYNRLSVCSVHVHVCACVSVRVCMRGFSYDPLKKMMIDVMSFFFYLSIYIYIYIYSSSFFFQ